MSFFFYIAGTVFIIYMTYVFCFMRDLKKPLIIIYTVMGCALLYGIYNLKIFINAQPDIFWVTLATSAGLPMWLYFILLFSYALIFFIRQKYNLLNLLTVLLFLYVLFFQHNSSIKAAWIACALQYILIVLTKIPLINTLQFKRHSNNKETFW